MEKIIRKSYKFRIYPSKSQVVILENTLDLCRELYNAALQERRDAWKLNKISINYFNQDRQLKEIREVNSDYRQVYSQVSQDVLKRLDRIFKAFFARVKRKEKAGFPRFKSASRYDSFTYPQVNNCAINISGNKINIPKIGKVKIKLSRTIQGELKTCTIKREIDKWFVVFSVETLSEALPKTDKQIGIDAGIENFITLSDGTQIRNFKYYESTQRKLRVAQRSVSRKVKGSNSRKKAVLRLRKIHQKIKNQRQDFQHKISTRLVKDYDLIAIEKLNILGMSKGILAKQINDVAWSSFFNMLRYKAESADKKLIEVNPNYTSQDCSACGERVKKALSVRIHQCLECGLKIHRDENAAKNILTLGQSVLESTKTVGL